MCIQRHLTQSELDHFDIDSAEWWKVVEVYAGGVRSPITKVPLTDEMQVAGLYVLWPYEQKPWLYDYTVEDKALGYSRYPLHALGFFVFPSQALAEEYLPKCQELQGPSKPPMNLTTVRCEVSGLLDVGMDSSGIPCATFRWLRLAPVAAEQSQPVQAISSMNT